MGKKRTYEPSIFEGRIMLPDEIEQIHKEVLEFERIDAISDPMRELIEELWPQLAHKLPPPKRRRAPIGGSTVDDYGVFAEGELVGRIIGRISGGAGVVAVTAATTAARGAEGRAVIWAWSPRPAACALIPAAAKTPNVKPAFPGAPTVS
jgi:hypothetical protein